MYTNIYFAKKINKQDCPLRNTNQELTSVMICWNGGVVSLKPSEGVSRITVEANGHHV